MKEIDIWSQFSRETQYGLIVENCQALCLEVLLVFVWGAEMPLFCYRINARL